MPLLSYFVVVGSALIGLLYLANAVLPHDTPIHSSNIQSRHSRHGSRSMQLPCPLQVRNPRCRLPQFLSRHRDMSRSRRRNSMLRQRRWRRTCPRRRSASSSPVSVNGGTISRRPTVGRATTGGGAIGGDATTVGAMFGAIRLGLERAQDGLALVVR